VDVKSKAIESYLDELESTIIYRYLAEKLAGKPISDTLRKIAEMEARHARFWREYLVKHGVDVDRFKPRKTRIKLYTLLYRLIGFGLTLKLLERDENEAINLYSWILEHGDLSDNERVELKKIIVDEYMHENTFLEEESRLKEFLDHVRDAILGMNDGLVEILSVSTGLAAAYGDPLNVALGGLIVGFAGALSMAIGSYVSVKSQREVNMSRRSRFLNLVKLVPETIHGIVEKLFHSKGFSIETSRQVADEVVSKNIELEEIAGVETSDNPLKAGIYTGLFYLLGAFIPLTPYFIGLPIPYALPSSLLIAAAMLGFVGFFVALTAGLKIKKKIVELILTGLGAAGATYLIGFMARTLLGIEVE